LEFAFSRQDGVMTRPEIYERWIQRQANWDDDEFLGKINSLQILRYRRLNERVVAFLGLIAGNAVESKPLLVDMGCGHADFSKELPERWRYIGLDPSPEQLAHGKQFLRGLMVVQGAAECPPLRNNCARVVLLKEVLDHGWDPSRIIRESHRILAPGGFLIVTVTNDRSWFKCLLPQVNKSLKEKQNDHFHFFSPSDLEQLAREARFDSVRLETYNHLKLPGFLERATGWAGLGFQRFLLGTTDALGRLLFPRWGGGMMLTAQKPLEDGCAVLPPLEFIVNQTSSVLPELLAVLVCPSCGSAIRSKGEDLECTACHRVFPVKEGIPSLMPELSKGS
jgi:SAM-dependent methyltransferase/uncharacterized protein YbaR (Trm112 family)